MLDAAAQAKDEAASPPALPRARGRAEVGVARRSGRTALARLAQEGSAKAFLPRVAGPAVEAVLVNSAGGMAGGDLFRWGAEVGAGAALVVSTQAAERVYRSTGAEARVEARLSVGAGGRLDWLPQETILFDCARLSRRLEVDMAADARLTLVETLVFGRAAMGERLSQTWVSDQWRIRRAGRLVHAEALRLDGDAGFALGRRALLGGAAAMATLVHLAPDAAERLEDARALAQAARARRGVEAAVSLKASVLIARLLGSDAQALRAALVDFLVAFRGEPPPRVWAL